MLDHCENIGGRRTADRVRHRVHSIPILLAILHVALPRVGLSADTDGAYSQGKKAAVENQWVLAARLMVQAIDVNPDEMKRSLYGPYIPNFFLGLSLYELGDCDLALQHLKRSRQFRVVLETKHLPKLEEMEKSCSARSRMLRRVRREIKSGFQLAERVETWTVDPLLTSFWSQGLPPPIVQLREAKLSLEQAEQLLETGTGLQVSKDRILQIRPLADDQISHSSQMALQVKDLLQHLDRTAQQHAKKAATVRLALLDDVLKLRLQVVRAWNSTSSRVRDSSESDLPSEFQRVTKLHLGEREVTLDELQAVKAQLANFLEDLGELAQRRPRRAPQWLHQAAEAYFAGQYDQVLTMLEDDTFSERQELAHFHLFRAAALYALYLIGDQPDPNLLSGAQWNVKSCLDANASLEPLAEAFSPRFVQFFREQSSLESQRR